jgi:hypothetical protein
MLGLQFCWKLRKLGLGGRTLVQVLILLDGMAGMNTAKIHIQRNVATYFLVAYHTFNCLRQVAKDNFVMRFMK